MPRIAPVPEGFNTVNVYLIVKNSLDALEFYTKAFGARAGTRMPGPTPRSTMHAEMRIGNSTVMLSDENPRWDAKSPETLGGSTLVSAPLRRGRRYDLRRCGGGRMRGDPAAHGRLLG